MYEQGFEDMRRRVPDVSKLRSATGFAPAIPLENALETIIHYFRSPITGTAPSVRRERAPEVVAERSQSGAASVTATGTG